MASLISVDEKIYFVGPASMTGERIRRMANVSPEKDLYMETSEGLFESISDDASVELRDGLKLYTKNWDGG
jgi:hypothetical protein